MAKTKINSYLFLGDRSTHGKCLICNKKRVLWNDMGLCLNCLEANYETREYIDLKRRIVPVRKILAKKGKEPNRKRIKQNVLPLPIGSYGNPEGLTEQDHYRYAINWMYAKQGTPMPPYKRLIKSRGNKCSVCDSKKRLEFHHNTVNKNIDVYLLETYRKMAEEAKSCVLLCKGCHDQIHDIKNYQQ